MARSRAASPKGDESSGADSRSESNFAVISRGPPLAAMAKAVAAGVRVVSFARAASDLEELFLQVTGAPPAEVT